MREALANSLEVAIIATLFALVLGSAAAFAVHRFRFFGRNTVSFLLILPIALPGIVTAIALNTTINNFQIPFGVLTIVIGHATFCIVVVYNNVIARLRRTPTSLVEASMDLGADGWQTFRYVTFPSIRTAVVAGALLAFALSFDEIVVTNFTAGSTHDPEVHLQQRPAAPEPTRGQRRGGRGDPRDVHPGVHRAADGGWAFRDGTRSRRRRTLSEPLQVLTARRIRAGAGRLGAQGALGAAAPRTARAAICWENSAAWIPWNSPSSHPTSWACATRISASVGTPSIGGASEESSSFRSSDSTSLSSSIERS